jgi:hypothetical protein
MVMMERARTVIPEFGRNVDNAEIHMTYEEQLKARAIGRQHDRRVEAITRITREIQEKTQQAKGETMQTLDNTVQGAALSAKDLRIQQMESWIVEAISRPAMPRELRMEGLEMVQDISPTARQAVERICPSLSRSQGRELSIER